MTDQDRIRFGKYSPPFKSNDGHLYVIVGSVAEANGRLECYKASDQADSWTIQDTANKPIKTLGTYRVLRVTQKRDVLYAGTYDGEKYEYHEFDMATDTWSAANEIVDSPKPTPSHPWITINVNDRDEVTIFWAGSEIEVIPNKVIDT